MNKLESDPGKDYYTGALAAGMTALIWAVQAIILKLAVVSVSPSLVVWFRFVFAFFVILLFSLMSDKKETLRILRRPPPKAILAGLFLGLNYYGFIKGLELTTPSNAQIGIQLGPFGLALFGIFHFKEKLNNLQKSGLILTPVGLVLFFKDQLGNFLYNEQALIAGYIWILFAAATWIAYSVLQKILGQTLKNSLVLMVVYLTAGLLFTPLTTPPQLLDWTPLIWTMMLILGGTTLLSYGFLAFSLSKTPASVVSMIITVNPLLTIFIMTNISAENSWGLLPERIQGLGNAGALFVVAGVILSVYRPRKKLL
ncbi:MAG: DMT family transporter [Pseudomonadota bacterium]|nr:DMT family transporter [Pseudomonadota bacterium]